jgi:phage-related protein (TIGR01555 family)
MPVFNNAVEVLRHLKRVITNSVGYTAKEAGFPNNTPNATKSTSSTTSLFPLKITDKERKEKYERGIGGAIVDKIIDDALKNGFVVNKIDTPEEPDRALTKKLTKVYNEKILTELDKALKRSRLYGYSFLLLGSKDGQDLNTPLTNKGATLDYIKAIPRTWVDDITYKKDDDGYKLIPEEVESIKLNPGMFGKSITIHASRLIMIINQGLEESDTPGCSVLDRPFNIITVIDHMLWSAGQTMWRVGGGLLGIDMPPDATPDDRDAALDSIGDINAKTVLAFPDGYKANVLNTASAVLNPAPYFESAIVQLAGVTEYPKTILYGLSTGAVTGSQLDRSTYYSKVVTRQSWISGFLVRILKGFMNGGGELKDEWELTWNSPYELTEKEKLEMKKLQSEIDYKRVNTYTETPDEIRARDGRQALTHEQLSLLKFMQTKAKEGTEPGVSYKGEPRKAETTITHL